METFYDLDKQKINQNIVPKVLCEQPVNHSIVVQ